MRLLDRQMAALELAEAAVDTCGAKAAACGELARVAAASGGAFAVPWGVCLPFGAMEAALQARSSQLAPGVRTGGNLQALNLCRGLLSICGECPAGTCCSHPMPACHADATRPRCGARHPRRPNIGA